MKFYLIAALMAFGLVTFVNARPSYEAEEEYPSLITDEDVVIYTNNHKHDNQIEIIDNSVDSEEEKEEEKPKEVRSKQCCFSCLKIVVEIKQTATARSGQCLAVGYTATDKL